MSLSSPTFDFDKIEMGKPTKFIPNGLYLPKMNVNNDENEKNSEIQTNSSTLTNKTNIMHVIQDLPIRAKAPIFGNNHNIPYLIKHRLLA